MNNVLDKDSSYSTHSSPSRLSLSKSFVIFSLVLQEKALSYDILCRRIGQTSRRRLVHRIDIVPCASKKDVKHTNDKPSDTSDPVQSRDTTYIALVFQTQAQESDKNQIKALSFESVHETKVFPKRLVDSSERLPVNELIEKQERRKDHHVDRQERRRQVGESSRRDVVNETQDSKSSHQAC